MVVPEVSILAGIDEGLRVVSEMVVSLGCCVVVVEAFWGDATGWLGAGDAMREDGFSTPGFSAL